METYLVSCKKNIMNNKSSIRGTKQNKLMLVANCAVCGKINRGLLKIKKQVY